MPRSRRTRGGNRAETESKPDHLREIRFLYSKAIGRAASVHRQGRERSTGLRPLCVSAVPAQATGGREHPIAEIGPEGRKSVAHGVSRGWTDIELVGAGF